MEGFRHAVWRLPPGVKNPRRLSGVFLLAPKWSLLLVIRYYADGITALNGCAVKGFSSKGRYDVTYCEGPIRILDLDYKVVKTIPIDVFDTSQEFVALIDHLYS